MVVLARARATYVTQSLGAFLRARARKAPRKAPLSCYSHITNYYYYVILRGPYLKK